MVNVNIDPDGVVNVDPHPHRTRMLRACQRLDAFVETLTIAVTTDGEQELDDLSLATFDAVVEEARTLAAADPVVKSVLSPLVKAIQQGTPMRCIDALHITRQLRIAVSPTPTAVDHGEVASTIRAAMDKI